MLAEADGFSITDGIICSFLTDEAEAMALVVAAALNIVFAVEWRITVKERIKKKHLTELGTFSLSVISLINWKPQRSSLCMKIRL